MMPWLRKQVGAWRMWWGWCPACNSDAPEVDECEVCRMGWKFRNEPRATMDVIWQRFLASGYR